MPGRARQRALAGAVGAVLFAVVSAQPVLDQASAPRPGTVYTYVSADRQALAGLGAGQVWDASGAVPFTTSTVQFYDTVAGQVAAQFPQAEVVMFLEGKETYLSSEADGLYALGTHIASPTITVGYTDAYRSLRFPCDLGTAWTDTFSGPYLYNGEPYVRAGSGSFSATGYGTLVLPEGPVHDVLRIDGVEHYTEVGGGNLFTFTNSFSLYYKPGLSHFVARNDSIATSFNGSPSPDQLRFLHMDSTSLGLVPDVARGIGVEVFPNPASDRLQVVFATEGAAMITVLDAHGRQVAREPVAPEAAGVRRVALDLHRTAAGLYTVVVTGQDGRRGTVRFAVVR